MAMASSLDIVVLRLAAQQHGVVSRKQLAGLGCDASTLDRRVRRGLLQPLTGAFVVAGAPPSFEQRCAAALLGTGVDDAMLSHRTSAHRLCFDGFAQPRIVDVTVPPDCVRQHEGVQFHRSLVASRDRVRVDGLLMTAAARTIIDLARSATRADLTAAVDSACRDRRTSPAHLSSRLDDLRGPGRHGVRLLDEVLAGRPSGGLHTDLERAFNALVRRAGVPMPRSQVRERTPDGRAVRVDFLFDGFGTVVEVDGHASHSTRPSRRRDARRVRSLYKGGKPVLPFTGDEVYWEPDDVVAELRELFGQPPAA